MNLNNVLGPEYIRSMPEIPEDWPQKHLLAAIGAIRHCEIHLGKLGEVPLALRWRDVRYKLEDKL